MVIIDYFQSFYHKPAERKPPKALALINQHVTVQTTYIINQYNPPIRIIAQLLTTLKLCTLIFISEWRDLEFSVDFERLIFEKLLHGSFIYSQSFYQKFVEEKTPQKYIFFHISNEDYIVNVCTRYFASLPFIKCNTELFSFPLLSILRVH